MSTVIVRPENRTVIVEQPRTFVTVRSPGPQGPAGEASSYVHEFAVPTTTVTIDHELGRYPSVSVVDSAGNVVIGNIRYISSDQIILYFDAAFSGVAYLN